MKTDTLGFEDGQRVATVTELMQRFPVMPPKLLLQLMVADVLIRTVTPFRLCECGCGASVHGKARLDSPACRQRVSRQRRELAASGPKQFGLVLQDEIPVPIPRVPAPKPEPAREGSEISAPARNDLEKQWDEFWGKGSTKPTPQPGKLGMIRELMQLGKSEFEIISAVQLSGHLVRAYMKHVLISQQASQSYSAKL